MSLILDILLMAFFVVILRLMSFLIIDSYWYGLTGLYLKIVPHILFIVIFSAMIIFIITCVRRARAGERFLPQPVVDNILSISLLIVLLTGHLVYTICYLEPDWQYIIADLYEQQTVTETMTVSDIGTVKISDGRFFDTHRVVIFTDKNDNALIIPASTDKIFNSDNYQKLITEFERNGNNKIPVEVTYFPNTSTIANVRILSSDSEKETVGIVSQQN